MEKQLSFFVQFIKVHLEADQCRSQIAMNKEKQTNTLALCLDFFAPPPDFL